VALNARNRTSLTRGHLERSAKFKQHGIISRHMKTGKTPPKPREVEIIHPSYQPSAAELREDLRIDATFEEAVKALVKPVRIQYVLPKKRQRSG